MNKLLKISAILATLALTACYDASFDRHFRGNESQEIICYSGGQPVLKDVSTGIVLESESGAGLYYRSKNTGELVQLYMDCFYTKPGKSAPLIQSTEKIAN